MNSLHIKLSSNKKNIKLFRNLVATYLIEFNPTLNIIDEIKTIVSELVTNSIVHGYDENNDQFIDLICNVENEILTMTVIDYGIGIPSIEKAIQPLYTSKPEQERSGLGLTIVDMFSDSIKIESDDDKTIIETKKLLY